MEKKYKLKNRLVFIGTYTNRFYLEPGKILQGKGEGIYIFNLDGASGSLNPVDIVNVGPNPSFLHLILSQKTLYIVNELKEFEGESTWSSQRLFSR